MIKYEQSTVIGGRAHFFGNCVATKIFWIWIDVSAYIIIVQDLIQVDFTRAISSHNFGHKVLFNLETKEEFRLEVREGLRNRMM